MKGKAIFGFIVSCVAQVLFAEAPAKGNCTVQGLVTLHSAGTDIQEALRSLARQGKVNIAISPTLHRKVSIDVECERPRVVLQRLVAQIKGSYCVEGNVIRVFRKPSQKCTDRPLQQYVPLDQ
jgi:type II secretory pathway component GspD/PulD (secretin)